MSRADRFFRRLLRLFPADFRGDFGDDMAATFSDQRRDVLAQEVPWRRFDSGGTRFAASLTTAPREHLDLLRGDVRYALRNLRAQPRLHHRRRRSRSPSASAPTPRCSPSSTACCCGRCPISDPGDARDDLREGAGRAGRQVPGSRRRTSKSSATRRSSYYGHVRVPQRDLRAVGDRGSPQRLVGTRVSPELFGVLGVVAGRGPRADARRTTARTRRSS